MLINKLDFAKNKKSTNRFLRRRCRYTPIGSRKFKSIITDLTTLKIGPETVHDYNSKISELETSFEQKIAMAVYYENIGNIPEMLNTLNSFKSTEQKESIRLLFLGIALEKNDKPDLAIKSYTYILSKETNNKLLKSAQFNINVCFEKKNDNEYLNFSHFFNDKTILMGNQRLRDKALTMHLIHCKKENKQFIYDEFLKESLEYEIINNPIGYMKTLLSYFDLKGETLSKNKIEEIITLSSEKSINSRMAILVKLHNLVNTEVTKSRIKSIIDSFIIKYKDYTLDKYYKKLNH